MNKKKKRDRQANQEKDILLNPEGYAKRKKNKRARILITSATFVFALVMILFVSYLVAVAIGEANLKSKVNAMTPQIKPIEATQVLTEEEEEIWQSGWIKYEDKIYAYNEDILTFLIMGIDKNSDIKEMEEGTKGGQADALFLFTLNPHNQEARIIGINRNTMTDVEIYNEQGAYVTTTKAQIAVQHGFGNGMEESCEYQKKAVSKLMYDLPIHGYCAIHMSAIETINDAVGGVEVTVLEDLSRRDSLLVEGETVHLMGKTAFWYVKYRDISKFGSADMRLERQKQYLTAFAAKAKEAVKKDITVPVKLYQAISSKMVTDVTVDEVAYLSSQAADYYFPEDGFRTLQGETVMGEQFEEFYADEEALYELILDVFYEEVTP